MLLLHCIIFVYHSLSTAYYGYKLSLCCLAPFLIYAPQHISEQILNCATFRVSVNIGLYNSNLSQKVE